MRVSCGGVSARSSLLALPLLRSISRLGCLGLLAGAAGCMMPTRISIGPTADTLGNMGFDARVSFGPHIGAKEIGFGATGHIGAGVPTGGQTTPLVGGVDLGGYYYEQKYAVSTYGGVGFVARGVPGDHFERGLSAHIGVVTPFFESFRPRRSHFSVGPGAGVMVGAAVHYEHLWSTSDTNRGVFFLPLVIDVRVIPL